VTLPTLFPLPTLAARCHRVTDSPALWRTRSASPVCAQQQQRSCEAPNSQRLRRMLGLSTACGHKWGAKQTSAGRIFLAVVSLYSDNNMLPAACVFQMLLGYWGKLFLYLSAELRCCTITWMHSRGSSQQSVRMLSFYRDCCAACPATCSATKKSRRCNVTRVHPKDVHCEARELLACALNCTRVQLSTLCYMHDIIKAQERQIRYKADRPRPLAKDATWQVVRKHRSARPDQTKGCLKRSV
jgi:hypothetical protein